MADSVLLGVGQLGIAAAGGVLGGGAVGQAHTGGHKQRVVAKAVGAGLGEADGAGALPCHFQCAAIGQHKADGRDELGGALPCRDVGHLVQQLSVIGGIIAVVPGIAGAVHTGGTVQGVDTQAGIIRHFIELRGIGIVNVARVFGVGAVKVSESLDLVVQLEAWDPTKNYQRTGLESEYYEILGVNIPSTSIPVSPGRNLAVVLETAAINNRQKKMGYNAAKELLIRLGLEGTIE